MIVKWPPRWCYIFLLLNLHLNRPHTNPKWKKNSAVLHKTTATYSLRHLMAKLHYVTENCHVSVELLRSLITRTAENWIRHVAVKGTRLVFHEWKRGAIMLVPTTSNMYYAVLPRRYRRVDVDPTNYHRSGPKLFGILINLTKHFGQEKHSWMHDTWSDKFRGLELLLRF